MTSMIVDKLPEMIAAAAMPLSKIGTMTVLSTGGDGASGSGASRVTSDVLNVAAQSMAMIKGLTGIDVAEALKKDRKVLTEGAPLKREPANLS